MSFSEIDFVDQENVEPYRLGNENHHVCFAIRIFDRSLPIDVSRCILGFSIDRECSSNLRPIC